MIHCKKNTIKSFSILKCTLFVLVFCIQVAHAWMPIAGLTQKRLNLLAGKLGEEEGGGISDGIGTSARFNTPYGVAVDSSGNVYVADTYNNTIRKITSAGLVTTFAGSAGPPGSADGTGSAARFNTPTGVAVDSSGNIYVADLYNHIIRKITSAGVVTTLAGTAGVAGSTDGTGAAARFNYPNGVAVDGSGNIYVADSTNHTIRKITSAGVVTTLAGTAGVAGSTDGTGAAARFNRPNGVAVDSGDNVYVADYNNHTIRKITSAGVVTTLAGTAGASGSVDGTGAAARFNYPNGVTVDSSGNVYEADYLNHTIRKITSAGVVTTLAGTAGAIGSANGTGAAARFYNPAGVAVDNSGNVYVAGNINNNIRKITSGGVVTTLAGTAVPYGSTDGTGAAARFYNPSGVAVDSSGNVYVADLNNHTIRKITSAGLVTTFAGSAGSFGSADGTGSAARFRAPSGVTIDSGGNLYVADNGNHTIRKITSGGVVTTLAGTAGLTGSTNGTGAAARFRYPSGVTVDSGGNVYVADSNNQIIRKITSAGVVTTLAGTAITSGSADGTGATARFYNPIGVAVDSGGNLFVTDQYNHTIRKITSAGVVTTFAGTAGSIGSIDDTGAAARFNNPVSVTVDSIGNLYVADNYNSTIRKITSAGVVTTLAGTTGAYGFIDGAGPTARFFQPFGVTVDNSGNVYVADNLNHAIRKITSAGVVTTIAGYQLTVRGSIDGSRSAARFNSPYGAAVDDSGNVYVTEINDHTIRKITSAGVVTTLAGTAGLADSTDGTGAAARFNYPAGVAVDSSGNIYVADTNNNTIRKITSAGVVTTFAGTAGTFGSIDGVGPAVRFYNPIGVAVDSGGNLFVTDQYNHTIRKITSAGVVTTLAGTAGSLGSVDGTGAAARFYNPNGVAIDSSGNVYVADQYNHTIRKITSAGVVTTLAGTAGAFGSTDATGAAARFNNPSGVSVDNSGNVYVADNYNNAIRKITPSGVVTSIAGAFQSPKSKLGALPGFTYRPSGIATKNGRIYFSSGHAILWAPAP